MERTNLPVWNVLLYIAGAGTILLLVSLPFYLYRQGVLWYFVGVAALIALVTWATHLASVPALD